MNTWLDSQNYAPLGLNTFQPFYVAQKNKTLNITSHQSFFIIRDAKTNYNN